jgi:hypothetical protein
MWLARYAGAQTHVVHESGGQSLEQGSLKRRRQGVHGHVGRWVACASHLRDEATSSFGDGEAAGCMVILRGKKRSKTSEGQG